MLAKKCSWRTRSSLAIALLIAIAAMASLPRGHFAAAQPTAATIDIPVGDDWFCNPSFEGQVCQNNLTAGDTVRWTLTEGNHTVTQCLDNTFSDGSCSGGWDSGTLDEGQSFQRSFNSAGTFYFRCNIHPTKMRGQLNVSAASVPTATPTPVPPSATATPTPAPQPSILATPTLTSPPSARAKPEATPTAPSAAFSTGSTTPTPTVTATEQPSSTVQPTLTASVREKSQPKPSPATRSSAAPGDDSGLSLLPWLFIGFVLGVGALLIALLSLLSPAFRGRVQALLAWLAALFQRKPRMPS